MDFPDQSDIYSAYPHLAGQEVNWLDTDSAEQYSANYNDTNKRKLLEKLRWTKHNITYTFNSNGFRAPEFKKNEPNIVFLGCSFTVGIGLNISDTFSHNVSQSLGLQNYNLGKGGGSNKTAFRVGHHWIPKLKPKIVVLMSPEITRSEIIMGGKAINLSAHIKEAETVLWPYVKIHMAEIENSNLDFLANTLALEKISTDVGARFILLRKKNDMLEAKERDGKILDYGRDLQHLGRSSHELTTEHILAKIHKA